MGHGNGVIDSWKLTERHRNVGEGNFSNKSERYQMPSKNYQNQSHAGFFFRRFSCFAFNLI